MHLINEIYKTLTFVSNCGDEEEETSRREATEEEMGGQINDGWNEEISTEHFYLWFLLVFAQT